MLQRGIWHEGGLIGPVRIPHFFCFRSLSSLSFLRGGRNGAEIRINDKSFQVISIRTRPSARLTSFQTHQCHRNQITSQGTTHWIRLTGWQLMQSDLDRFVSSQPAASPPNISFTSQEVRDRKSAFVAYIIPATDPSQVRNAIAHVRRTHASRPPAHEVAAWRFMTLKPGVTGLGGEEDFEVVSAYDDDGEKWAGGRVLNIMKQRGVMDAVVVVSRWWAHTLVCCGRV